MLCARNGHSFLWMQFLRYQKFVFSHNHSAYTFCIRKKKSDFGHVTFTSYMSYLFFLLPLRLWTSFLHVLLHQCLLQSCFPKRVQALWRPFADRWAWKQVGNTRVALKNSSMELKKNNNEAFLSQLPTPPCPNPSARYKRASVI